MALSLLEMRMGHAGQGGTSQSLAWPHPKPTTVQPGPVRANSVHDDVTYRIGNTAVRRWSWASSVTEYQLSDSTVALLTCTTLCCSQLQDNKNSAFVTYSYIYDFPCVLQAV